MKIRKGDSVLVIAGKNKDTSKVRTVLATHPKTEQVTIEDVNVVKRHQKNRRTRSQGQIIEIAKPIHASNVSLVEDGKAVRAGYEMKDGKKVRISRASGKEI